MTEITFSHAIKHRTTLFLTLILTVCSTDNGKDTFKINHFKESSFWKALKTESSKKVTYNIKYQICHQSNRYHLTVLFAEWSYTISRIRVC